MGCISLSGKFPECKSVVEAGLAALAAGLALRFVPMGAAARMNADAGLALAWAVSAAGTAVLARGLRSTPKAFWRAFGFGIFLRAAVLVGLMAHEWRRDGAAPLLASYALGVAGLVLMESRRMSSLAGRA